MIEPSSGGTNHNSERDYLIFEVLLAEKTQQQMATMIVNMSKKFIEADLQLRQDINMFI